MNDPSGPTHCACGDATSRTSHGLIHRDNEPYAAYHAGWSEDHPSRGIFLAITTGERGEGARADDQVCIVMRVRPAGPEIHFTVIDPDESPWGEMPLRTSALSCADALKHPMLQEIFQVAEHIIDFDPSVRGFIDAINQPRTLLEIPGHRLPHPEAYYEQVYDRLSKVTDGLSDDEYKQAFRCELEAVRTEAATPGTLLYKLLAGQ